MNPITQSADNLPTAQPEGQRGQTYTDLDGRFHVVSRSEKPISSIGHESYDVPDTTATALGSTVVRSVGIQASSANADSVFVGGDGVTDSDGFELTPGKELYLSEVDLAEVFVVSTGAGNTVRLLKVVA